MQAGPIPECVWSKVGPYLEKVARSLAGRASLAGMDGDDLYQSAVLACLVKWPDLDQTRPAHSLAGWLRRRGIGEMRDALRSRGLYTRRHLDDLINGRGWRLVSLSAPNGRRTEGYHEFRPRSMLDTLADPKSPDPSAIDGEEDLFLSLARRCGIPTEGRDYRILWDYYGRGLLMREAGAACGLSESRVSQIHDREIARAREACGV